MRAAPLLFAALLPLACSAQVDPAYRGEPLAVLRGVLRNLATPARLPPAQAVVAWVPIQPGGSSEWSLSRVRVDAAFPGTFEIPLFAPPPPSHLMRLSADEREPPIGIGAVAVVREGAVAGDPNAYLGSAEKVLVLYFGGDVEAGTKSAALFAAPLRAGYHLFPITYAASTATQLLECEDGLRAHGCTETQSAAACSDLPIGTGAVDYHSDVIGAPFDLNIHGNCQVR